MDDALGELQQAHSFKGAVMTHERVLTIAHMRMFQQISHKLLQKMKVYNIFWHCSVSNLIKTALFVII